MDVIMKPTKQSADAVLGQITSLGTDVASDIGQFVVQPVIDVAHGAGNIRTSTNTDDASNHDKIDMFAKTASAIFHSVVIYAIADIRNLIRNHREKMVTDNAIIQQMMDLPITDVNIMVIIFENLTLLQEVMKNGEIDFYIAAVKRYRKGMADAAQAEISGSNNEPTTTAQSPQPPFSRTRRRSIYESIKEQRASNTLEVFDDENCLKELVYGIAVNREKKQIFITFRGSVTTRDWMVDGKFFLTTVPNPLLHLNQQQQQGNADDGTAHKNRVESKFSIPQSKNIGIHAGFYEYLFASRSKTDATNKYTQILQSLKTLLARDEALKSYPINVTGHSLGGALATLFAFHLVLEKDIILPQTPITCISFASPKAGNIQFGRAFQELELQKKIVCLRVANHRDLITERPDRLTCWTFCLQDSIFRHVGIELLLYPERPKRTNKAQNNNDRDKMFRIRYPRVRRSRLSQFSDDFFLSLINTIHCTASVTCGCCIHDYMKWHSCDEYLNRVENIESVLESVPMQAMYERYHNAVADDSKEFSMRLLSANKSQNLPSNK